MSTRVQKGITAGMALVGAGVMAAIPAAQQAPEVLRSAEANVQLTAALTGTPAENLALSAQRTLTGLVGAPVGLGQAAIALSQGQNLAAQAILKEVVDGPMWAADPAIYALDDLLPAPIGGSPGNVQEQRGTSLITQFRADQLIAARDDIKDAIGDALTVGPPNVQTEVSPTYAAARLGAGLAVSATRAAQSAVTAPLGLVAVAQGLQNSFETGNNTALYNALEAYIDGPNYVADPIVFAVDDVLPAPIGGDPSTTPNNMGGSEVSKFRATTLLGARDQVRGAVKSVLGVNSNSLGARSLSADDAKVGSSTVSTNAAAANKNNRPVSTAVKAVGNEIKAAADRFERRVNKLASAASNKPAAKPSEANAE